MKTFILQKYPSTKAFTLVETLVATAIITMVILGPLTVAITSASYAKDSKDAITATYLAHEGIELVRFKRDSAFVECQNGVSTCIPQSFAAAQMENIQQASWRTFKERMRNAVNPILGLQPSCFSDDNQDGCSFDTFGITNTGSDAGERFIGTDDRCSTLYNDNRVDQQYGYNTAGFGFTDRMYACKASGASYSYMDSGYKRIIKLTSLSRPFADTYEKTYEDDVRVESTVTYTRGMGIKHTARAIDYLHARP